MRRRPREDSSGINHNHPSLALLRPRSNKTTTTPPTSIAQERTKSCKLILDTELREHAGILRWN